MIIVIISRFVKNWVLQCPGHLADKHADIAKKIDDMGDKFRPAMQAGWLAYITKTYNKKAFSTGPALGRGPLIVADDD